MSSNSTIIHKLQHAINDKGGRILYQTSQFYSDEKNKPVTIYHIRQAVPQEGKRSKYIELFKSTSQIQIVLFLRDMWYGMNNWELPIDNNTWNKIREEKNNGGIKIASKKKEFTEPV